MPLHLAAATPTSGLSDSQALGYLMTAEGFLLAAIALSITLSAPNQPRPRSFGRVTPVHIARGAAITAALIGLGAVMAWFRLFTGGDFGGFDQAVTAGALLLGLVAQPVAACYLAFGAKS